MGYEWDVFVSYKHDDEMGSWVSEHLAPFLTTFVGNALNRPARIFHDRTGISSGQSWPLRLQQAVGRSRSLVAVWTPLYFSSDWCRRECAAMLRREQEMEFRTLRNPNGLIVPINVFDGKHFPPRARDIQAFDLQRFWISGPAFRSSPLYVDFQVELKTFALDLAAVIAGAPAWAESFENNSWLQADVSELMPPPITNFEFMGIE